MKIKTIDNLLQTEMDRKDFLTYLGVTTLTLTGISGALRVITRNPRMAGKAGGYGRSVYGGTKSR